MKWRDWQLLIILALLCYIALNLTLTRWVGQQPPALQPTRTPLPTLESRAPDPIGRIVLPTNTPRPTRTPTVLPTRTATPSLTPSVVTSTPALVQPQDTPTPVVETIKHTVQRGENLLTIAQRYGTTVQAIVEANNLTNPDLIFVDQLLTIPITPEPSPTATPST